MRSEQYTIASTPHKAAAVAPVERHSNGWTAGRDPRGVSQADLTAAGHSLQEPRWDARIKPLKAAACGHPVTADGKLGVDQRTQHVLGVRLVIELTTTLDCAVGLPWPPPEGDGWFLVSRWPTERISMWRRLYLKT